MKSDSKVVLDPDLIDLTMIPPPMTPDEVNLVIIAIAVLTINLLLRMAPPAYSPLPAPPHPPPSLTDSLWRLS